jgi:AraC-like DNA-binding protein
MCCFQRFVIRSRRPYRCTNTKLHTSVCCSKDRIGSAARILRSATSRIRLCSIRPAKALVYELCTYIASQSLNEPNEPAWLAQVDFAVNEQFRAPLDILKIAEETGVHPAHLCRTFRRFRDHTISDALLRARVQYVARRLSESDEPLAAIATESGFSDQSHMTRMFKRFTGHPPGEHRRDIAVKI